MRGKAKCNIGTQNTKEIETMTLKLGTYFYLMFTIM